MTATLLIIASLMACAAFILLNSDVYEEWKKERLKRPYPSPISDAHRDIFKPLI